MAGIRLRHVERFKDRYGKTRFYYRVGKGKRVALSGEPGTEEFARSYQDAAKVYSRPATSDAGTFNALAKLYFASSKFKKLNSATQGNTQRILGRFLDKHGHRLVAQMTRGHVEILYAEKEKTPAAANNFLKKLRVLVKFAIRLEWISRDPTQQIDKFKEGTFHTWTEAELAQFEKRWPIGTSERTAYALALYTGQRRSDLHRMAWADVDGNACNYINVTQQKGGAKLRIPMHKALRETIEKVSRSQNIIIAKENGQAYTVESFGNLMADAIQLAGLSKRCVLHGLRKAAARRLAEAGCTVHQIAAITGHKTLGEIERYTKAVSQERLADQAILSLGKH